MTLNEFIARATGFFDKAEAQIGVSADVAKLTSDLATSNAEITTLKAQLAEAGANYTKLAADLAAKDSEIAALKAEATEAKSKADSVIASQGIPPGDLPKAGEPSEKPKPQAIAEQFLAIKDPKEKNLFFIAHEAEIKAARK